MKRIAMVISLIGCRQPEDKPSTPCTGDTCAEEEAELCFTDADNDGFRSEETIASQDADCTDPGEASELISPGDCDDSDPSRSPDAEELIADGIDSDCDGVELCFTDADGDGFRSEETIASQDADCTDPGEAFLSDAVDCADTDPELSIVSTSDLQSGFSSAENTETSEWSYRYTTSLDSTDYLLLPLSGVSHFTDLWVPGPHPDLWSIGDDVVPWAGRNDTGVAQGIDIMSWPAGAVAIHPAATARVAVSWRAPVSGQAVVTAQFADADPVWEGALWLIESGGTVLAQGALDASGGALSSGVQTQEMAVAAGDYVHFVVDPRGPGEDLCFEPSCSDTTLIDVTIELCGAP